MRALETIQTALLASETGHLVFSTLHTTHATETVQRIIAVFPPPEQKQIRLQLAATLKAVISQRLVRRADDKGRVPAVEVMIATADRKSTRLNSSHGYISYAVFCLKKKKKDRAHARRRTWRD